jgi:hypothetical protein
LESKPLVGESVAEVVDIQYSIIFNGQRCPIAIGETKRNIIKADQWQDGRLTSENQKALSRELRGFE